MARETPPAVAGRNHKRANGTIPHPGSNARIRIPEGTEPPTTPVPQRPKLDSETATLLANATTPGQRIEAAQYIIFAGIAARCPYKQIEDAVGIPAGSLTTLLLGRRAYVVSWAAALIEAANEEDRLARQFLASGTGNAKDKEVRLRINQANSLRAVGEGRRRFAEALLRKGSVIAEDEEAEAAAASAKERHKKRARTWIADPLESLRPTPATVAAPANTLPTHAAEATPDPAELLKQMTDAQLQAARVKLKGTIVSCQTAGEPWDHLKPFAALMRAELAARNGVPA